MTTRRVQARVDGVVQGVGFRPYVYRLAGDHGLSGYVLNDVAGVVLEVEGPPEAVAAFLTELPASAPPLARVESITIAELEPTGEAGFAIVVSDPSGRADALVSPDTTTCDDCLAELFDPTDRRHRYPFINCTNCGPRFTIVRDVPYDRPLTTMAGFAMCADCRAEYEDPADRRFHAEPIACPVCGPATTPSVEDAAALLRGGAIVAVKGLGGYHLACRADDEHAVATLRARKHREDKPFALMVADADAARELVQLSDVEVELLTSPARPIILATRLPAARVAAAVAPGNPALGVMLPYTPLHHLLLADLGAPLVLTSGNVSDEPIAYVDDDARTRLASIADAFLVHDRPIHMRTDDSVARVVAGKPTLLRRSRGYVPESIALPVAADRHVLAVGAELKNTFCVARGARAWVGHHIGDLRNEPALRSFTEGIAHFERLFAVTPQVVAHDLHPDYASTAYATERDDVELLGVQHHHAHLAAVLAEHGETGPAVGAIYDGSGYGTDGTVWGGELLTGDLACFERAGHLLPATLPGGDAAVREPWRMAAAWGVAAGDVTRPARVAIDDERWATVVRMASTGFAAPVTTSMGRLFDAVAALCGIRTTTNYEGQAAIELEAAATQAVLGRGAMPAPGYTLEIDAAPGEKLVLDPRPTLAALLADLDAGVSVPLVAQRFHRAVALATIDALERIAAARNLDLAVLSGGVFQNRLLLEATAAGLTAAGLRVLLPQRLPANDGGISYGQAAIAAAKMAGR